MLQFTPTPVHQEVTEILTEHEERLEVVQHLFPPEPAPGNPIAQCVLDVFTALPKKFKPVLRSEWTQEWTLIAGIVLSKGKVYRYLYDLSLRPLILA